MYTSVLDITHLHTICSLFPAKLAYGFMVVINIAFGIIFWLPLRWNAHYVAHHGYDRRIISVLAGGLLVRSIHFAYGNTLLFYTALTWFSFMWSIGENQPLRFLFIIPQPYLSGMLTHTHYYFLSLFTGMYFGISLLLFETLKLALPILRETWLLWLPSLISSPRSDHTYLHRTIQWKNHWIIWHLPPWLYWQP